MIIGHSDEAKSPVFLIRTLKIGLTFFSLCNVKKIDSSNLHIDIPCWSVSNQPCLFAVPIHRQHIFFTASLTVYTLNF